MMAAVAGALDDAPVMGGDGGIDQIASEPPKTRKSPILVCAGEPAVADHVGDQDRRDFPGLAHSSRSPALRSPSKVLRRFDIALIAKTSIENVPRSTSSPPALLGAAGDVSR